MEPSEPATPAPPPTLSAEEEEVVLLLAAYPRLGGRELLARLPGPISQPTLSRRIERLVKAGIVRREGKARSTIYRLADPRAYVSLPMQRRTPAAYDLDWLARIDPASTRFFSTEEESRLIAIGRAPGVTPNLFYERIFERFLIDLSWASSKMEGNTYTLLDTERLVTLGESAEGKELEEATMILNHKRAVMYLVENVAEVAVSARDIKNLHALLSRDLVREGEPGKLRTTIVNITNSQYSPLSVPQQIEEQFAQMVDKASRFSSPLEQSFFLLAAISYLQPFIDVNKRTARLAANIPLFKAGLCPLSYRHMDSQRYLGGLLLFYETLNHGALKDAYIDGYVRSAQALKLHFEEHRRQPARIDIAYRKGIDMVVREIVRNADAGVSADGIIQRWLSSIPENDRAPVGNGIRIRVEALTPDNAVMYGLFPDEVEAFRARYPRQ